MELCATAVTVPWRVEDFFDQTHADTDCSPIDRFFEAHEKLNLLCTPDIIRDHKVLGGLALLGSVSAVESYLREVIRRIVNIDILARNACADAPITFGAAKVHTPEMLPEALTESYSFITGKNIHKALGDLLDIKGNFPPGVQTVVDDFERVCQLRHCMVHRFGKLGTKNALVLGLDALANHIEKPLLVEYPRLQTLFQINYNTVKTLNNFLLQRLLDRSSQISGQWTGDLRKDRKRFRRYYDLFYSQKEPPTSNNGLAAAYKSFKAEYKPRP